MSTIQLAEPVGEDLVPVLLLHRDVRKLAGTLDRTAVLGLIKLYYLLQEHRIALANQARTLTDREQPTEVIDHFYAQVAKLEKQLVATLGTWAAAQPAGSWLQAQVGIGPVLSAGLLAHLDISRAPTSGHFWRFAGLDPTTRWRKGEKRPWNADLKVLCWRAADSFVKTSGNERSFYGKLYRDRKLQELTRDGRAQTGEIIGPSQFAEQAATALAERTIKDAALKACYEGGHLPLGRLDLRARRYAVKLLLAHLHDVLWRETYKSEPPLPYSIAHQGHAHVIDPPPGPGES